MTKEMALALNEQANQRVAAAREAGKTSISSQTEGLEQAHALYTEALKHDSTNAEIYYNRSGVSDMLGWHNQADVDFDSAINYAPADMKNRLIAEKSNNRLPLASAEASLYTPAAHQR